MAKTGHLICVFLLVAAYVTISHFPLRLAVWMSGPKASAAFSARNVTGTLWSGSAREAAFNGLFLGDLQLRSSFLKVLSGAPLTQLRWEGPRSNGTALLSVGSDTISLSRIESRIGISLGSLTGIAQISNGMVVQSKQQCIDASGDIILTTGAAQSPNTGRLNCSDGSLVLSLDMGGTTRAIALAGAL